MALESALGGDFMKDVLPALTALIAVLAVYIAYQQQLTTRRKLKLDLYDKRFKVYYGLMELIAAVVREANVTTSQLFKFLAETNESDFLFGAEIPKYLREVYSRAVDVHAQMTKLGSDNLPVGPERNQVSEEHSATLKWFVEQLEVAKSKFSPYLAFRQAE